MRYHTLALLLTCAALTVAGCPTGPSPQAVAAASSGEPPDAGCVRTFDPHTGAENPTDCPPPPDAQCGVMRCEEDGACRPDPFPVGAACDAGTCDGMGSCAPAVPPVVQH